jgi:hypothetical protein
MKITSARYTEVAVDRFQAYNKRSANLKLKENDWKIRSTMIDAGSLKHELLNRLRSISAANVLREVGTFGMWAFITKSHINLNMNHRSADDYY